MPPSFCLPIILSFLCSLRFLLLSLPRSVFIGVHPWLKYLDTEIAYSILPAVMTRFIQSASASIREIRGKTSVPFATFCSPFLLQAVRLCSAMSAYVRLCLPKNVESRNPKAHLTARCQVRTPDLTSRTFIKPLSTLIPDGLTAQNPQKLAVRTPTSDLRPPISDLSIDLHLSPSCAFAKLHIAEQFHWVFAPMCTCVQLGAPLSGKMKKSRMLHKPHITAHTNPFVRLTCGGARTASSSSLTLNSDLRPLTSDLCPLW